MEGEILTRDDFLAYMGAFEERLKGKRTNLTTRKEIIGEIGQDAYYDGVRKGFLTPIQNGARNAKIRIERREYKAYLEHLKKIKCDGFINS